MELGNSVTVPPAGLRQVKANIVSIVITVDDDGPISVQRMRADAIKGSGLSQRKRLFDCWSVDSEEIPRQNRGILVGKSE